eukprot:scaffold6280_cov97-Isochrysis_galbana.AAC.1
MPPGYTARGGAGVSPRVEAAAVPPPALPAPSQVEPPAWPRGMGWSRRDCLRETRGWTPASALLTASSSTSSIA